MIFHHTEQNIIRVGNVRMPLSQFLCMEPDYAKPHGYSSIYYDGSSGTTYAKIGSTTVCVSDSQLNFDDYLTKEYYYSMIIKRDSAHAGS